MHQFKRLALLFSLLVSTITGCSHKKNIAEKTIHADAHHTKKKRKNTKNSTPQVTVWVHGTRSIDFVSDLIHSVPHRGMKLVTDIPAHYRIGSVIKTLAESDPERFPLEHFYVYGWSGKLSFEAREKAAHDLYKRLEKLQDSYAKKYGQHPTIRLITHSHGGNVALNMAKIKDPQCSFTIRQAILLACPVQHETKYFVEDPIFDEVYSLYSKNDLIQVLDPQGLYRTQNNETRKLEFSDRVFPAADRLKQAELEINENGLGHAGFIFHTFAKTLPVILDEMETWHTQAEAESHKKLKIKTC